MVRGLRALSFFRYLMLLIALTFLTIASATYLRDVSNPGNYGYGYGNIGPYAKQYETDFLSSQPHHLSFTTSDEDFEGVLTIKNMYGDLVLEKRFKHSVSADFKPVRGFYVMNITSLYEKEVGFSLSITYDITELEDDVIFPSIYVSLGFMLFFVLLDVVVRTVERTGAC
ncbi:MAG: hypothetical protein FGF53_09815 [Candidatus Brockarchaeota archaeon]|nr:hypothetical protein [Candidatus Brockarchaeota archaeon]